MRRADRLTVLTLSLAAVLAGDVAAQSPAQAPVTRTRVEKKWDALISAARNQIKVPVELTDARQEREEATRQASIVAAVDAIEPDESTAAATVRRLAGAIKTSPEGTEAGIVIAPFVLAGSEKLQGLEITFASLKGDFTRAAASYTWDLSPELEDIWRQPNACPASEERDEELQKPRDFYVNACTQVIAALPGEVPASMTLESELRSSYRTRVRQARIACGLSEGAAGEPTVATVAEAIQLVRRAVDITNQVSARTDGFIPTHATVLALALRQDAEAFTDWSVPGATSCYSAKDIRGYFQQLYWEKRKWKFAASASWDLFPRKYGFSPDDSRLPRGDVSVRELRASFSTSRAGTEMSAGIGVGHTREELPDELQGHVAPSVSIARAVSLLPNKKPLLKGGQLNVENGELPPRLVFGLILEAELALDRPASQETRFNAAKIQPHVDFLITDKLAFRLGVPVKAEIALRKAKDEVPATATTPAVPAVTERRALQWTVPVAIVAVIKM